MAQVWEDWEITWTRISPGLWCLTMKFQSSPRPLVREGGEEKGGMGEEEQRDGRGGREGWERRERRMGEERGMGDEGEKDGRGVGGIGEEEGTKGGKAVRDE